MTRKNFTPKIVIQSFKFHWFFVRQSIWMQFTNKYMILKILPLLIKTIIVSPIRF